MSSVRAFASSAQPAKESLSLPRPIFGPAENLLAIPALAVIASVFVVAVHHLRDGYNLDIGSGIFLALAQQAREGQLYPDLRSGEQFGGTRYMPLPFVLHAGIAALTGENLASGKGLALALAMVLGWQVFAAARRLGCPAVPAFASAALVLASGSGFLAATTVRGDLLPVVLQMAALGLAGSPASRRGGWAGVLCALAVLAKLTAGWAGVAIFLHLIRGGRQRAARFLAAWLGSLAAGLVVLHLASAGRMVDNLTALSAAGLDGPLALARGPYRLLVFLGKGGSVTHCLFPLAVLAAWLARRGGRWTVYHTAWLASLLILAVVFADLGAVSNHLLDAVVLSALVIAAAWPAEDTERARVLRPALALAVGWCLVTCWAYGLAQESRSALVHLRGGDARFPAKPLAGLVGDGETVLTDDPWVSVSRGRWPVVLDAVSLARGVAAAPGCADLLMRRIRERHFAKVVLSSLPAEPGELDAVYFGRPVAEAIRTNYSLWRRSGGYTIFLPRRAD